MVVYTLNGNPDSQDALDRGCFLKYPDGQLLKKHSKYFPIVPCYLLDGNNPKAADWYAGLYQKWEVDGVKEDTMMNLGGAYPDVFNQALAKLANDGVLVMARCGSYSSPGSLLRS